MFDIIVPTFNAGPRFSQLLEKLTHQTIKPQNIIIIDSGSSDSTLQTAKEYSCKIITIENKNFDHGTSRNLAAAEVTSEFMIFITQDAIPADEYTIAELIKPIQADPNVAICYGRQLPMPHVRPLESFARQFNYPAQSILKTKDDIATLGIKTFFCSNACSAIRHSIFNKLGGFKNNAIANEDMLFAAKAILQGYSVYYSAEARVYHSHDYSLFETFKRYFNIGRFFADNRWLTKHASLKNYSGVMLKTGVKTFWQERIPHYIVALLAEFIVKAIAFKFGWYYHKLFCTAGNQS